MRSATLPRTNEPSSGMWCGVHGKTWLPFDEIEAGLELGSDDVMFVAGSLAEGLGDDESDVNIYVVRGDTSSPLFVPPEYGWEVVQTPYSGIATTNGQTQTTLTRWSESLKRSICVEFWDADVLDAALQSLATTTGEAAGFGKGLFVQTPPFRVARFYHAMCIGFCLKGSERLSILRAKVPVPSYCFMRFNEIAGNHADYVDIIGAFRNGDYLRSYDLAAQFLTAQMQALTYLHFNTNFRRKWLLQHILQLPPRCAGIAASFVDCAYGRQGTVASFKSRTIDCMEVVDLLFTEFASALSGSTNFRWTHRLGDAAGEGARQAAVVNFRRSVIGLAAPGCVAGLTAR